MASTRSEAYTKEEVTGLVELAARLDELAADAGGLTYDELVSVAGEVGISEAAVAQAVALDRRDRRRRLRDARKQVRRRMRFIRHATVYAVVVSALLLIDALNGGGWWFFYVAALWGAVLALQGIRFLTRKRGPVEEILFARQLRGEGA